MGKKLIAGILAAALMFSQLHLTAFAVEAGEEAVITSEEAEETEKEGVEASEGVTEGEDVIEASEEAEEESVEAADAIETGEEAEEEESIEDADVVEERSEDSVTSGTCGENLSWEYTYNTLRISITDEDETADYDMWEPL